MPFVTVTLQNVPANVVPANVQQNQPAQLQGNVPANQPQPAQGAAQPQQVQPNPAAILANAQQRFPGADPLILRGMATPLSRPQRVLNQAEQLRANPRRDVAPMMVGQGENSRVALMPTKGVHGPDKATVIQGYVNEGKAIYDDVMNGVYAQGGQQPNKHDVAKVMWFLQALASGKAAESSGNPQGPALYEEGAMFVEDPNNHLETFLSRANSYERASSHMHGYQDMGGAYHPRGVDLRNVDTPNEFKTVMFARLPHEDALADGPRGTGGKHMLFVKMEPHGCRGLTPRGSGTPRDHETPASVWKGVKRFCLNAKDLFMHSIGFARSMGQRLGFVAVVGQNNRERIPNDVKTAYQGVINQAEARGLGVIKNVLTNRSPLSDASGIKQMLFNLEQAIGQAATYPGNDDFFGGLTALHNSLLLHGDHPTLRIGNEVILTRDEMNAGFASPIRLLTQGGAPLTVHGGLHGIALEQAQIGREYFLADAALQRQYARQFVVDARRGTYNIAGQQNREEQIAAPAAQQVRSADEMDQAAARAIDSLLRLTGEQATRTPQALVELSSGGTRETAEEFANALDHAPVTKALMNMCHQGLAADVGNQILREISAITGARMEQRSVSYSIDRDLQPNDDGSQTYHLVSSSDLQLAEEELLVEGNWVRLDRAQSHIHTRVALDIRVYPDGNMRVHYPEAPSYEITLTPAQLPQP
jgi:hypothetical protein